jgi:fatty acid desaturase
VAGDLRQELRHIRRAIDGRIFAVKLTVLVVVIGAGAALVAFGTIWSVPAGVLLLGLMYAHALELQHEALHGIGFRRPQANVVAGVLLGIPMLTSFAAYRTSHMRHHRDLGTPENKEFFDYGDQYGDEGRSKLGNLVSWAYRLSMIAHYGQFFLLVAKSVTVRPLDGEKPVTARHIRRDYLIMAALLAATLAWTAVTGNLLLVWLWFVPMVLVAAPAHALVELPEHFRCETGTTDVFRNTRTIRSNRFMAWFTNGNNFHVEHHFMPSLPISQLPELHDALDGRVEYDHLHPSYAEFFAHLRKTAPRPSEDKVTNA